MTDEINRKKKSKFDPDLANDVLEWIRLVLEDAGRIDAAARIKRITTSGDVKEILKDGKILGHLANAIEPGSIKISFSHMVSKQKENIKYFLEFCEKFGVPKADLFDVDDLFEAQDIPRVLDGIKALGQIAKTKGYNGPVLGVEESTESKNEFTEKQLFAYEGSIELKAGSNKGASRAGYVFGRTRTIVDK